MKNEKIGIFDSGLGGMTVLKQLINLLPNENYLYYGDSGNAPYGTGKTKEDIQKLCSKIIEFFINNNCKYVVIACNTATIAAYEYLKEKYNIPMIGIIEAGAMSTLAHTKNKKIAVFSTEFTAKSNAYKDKINFFDRDIEVEQIACTEFASMIEKGWETFDDRDELMKKYATKVPKDVDIIVLGCTHYPLIVEDFKKCFSVPIIDPAIELSLQVKKYLLENNLLNENKQRGNTTFFTTGDLQKFKSTAEKFLGEKIEAYKI